MLKGLGCYTKCKTKTPKTDSTFMNRTREDKGYRKTQTAEEKKKGQGDFYTN